MTTSGGSLESDRAVSSTLGYVLTLAIVTLLVSGLLIAAGDFVDGQREQVVRSELEVVNQRLVSALQSADRMAVAAGETGEVAVEARLPERIGGVTYTVAVVQPGDWDDETFVRLSTADPAVTVETPLKNDSTVSLTAVSGGDVRIASDGDRLEVSRD